MCERMGGGLSTGDDFVALNRAFIYAGTPSVVASLWTVDDEATRMLMESFFKHLLAGAGEAEALRRAQSGLRESDEKYRHPYYWAAFALTGDPGPLLASKPG